MKLKDINEIKKDGLVVFMPSGIQATLFNEDNNIVVKYFNLAEDKYSKEDFKQLIDEGIFVFDKHINNPVMESKENSIKQILAKKGYIRKSLIENFSQYDQSYYVIDNDGEQEGPFDSYEEANEYIESRTNGDEQLAADYSIITAEEFEACNEAFNQHDCKPGDVFTALKDKEKEYLTPDFKIELLQSLDKIAKEYPDVHIRQQAQTFIDELGIQEYYDIKKVKDFISKNKEILSVKESVNEERGEYAFNASLQYIADQVQEGITSGYEDEEFGNWFLETSLDDKFNTMDKHIKDYIFLCISNPIYEGHISYKDLQIVFTAKSGFSKQQLETLDLFSPEELDDLSNNDLNCYMDYEIKFDNKINDPVEESFKVKKKSKKKIEDSLQEAIYLKDQEGNEIGPFEDQDAKEQYLKDQKSHGNNKEYEEVIKEENMAQKNEDCYKVYSTIDPEAQPTCFNSWNEVEDHLNQAWGEYKASKAKENTDFGTEQDKDDFFSNFDIAIEPVEVPVEEIPTEGIELDVADVCPECNEDPCVCNNETDENVMEEDLQEERQEETNEQPQEDEVGEELEDEGDTTEITTPEQAAEKVDDVEDALDSIEDFIQSLLDDEDEEQLDEMCMQKLPDVEEAKAKNKETDELETEFRTIRKNALANPSLYGGRYTQKNIKDARKQFLADKKAKTEDFSDNMGMLTDINDLDFPDALHDAVDTKEDGSLYRISDLAKELQDVKAAMEDLKNDFKSELTTMIQDLKNDLKLEVNNVENKVQDTKSAVDNLTSEEDELEDLEMEQPEETEQPEEQPEEANDEEAEMEEAYEKSLSGNRIFESIKKIIATNDHPKKLISIKTIAEKLREDYGINTNLETDFGRTTYSQVAQFINKTSLKECVCDPAIEEAERKKSMLGKAASWLSTGLMGRMQETRQRELNENIAQIKAEIDKKVQQGADAEQLKDEITLGAENEEEAKQAKQYAIDKLTSNQKAESLKSKLLKTSGKSVFGGMNIRG